MKICKQYKMGTRGQFYLYITISGKRFLVYTCYTQYDAYEWIDGVYELLGELLASDPVAVFALVEQMTAKFGSEMGYFACDTELTVHEELELETTPEEAVFDIFRRIQADGMEYCKPFSTFHGVTAGDCYYPTTDDQCDMKLCRRSLPSALAELQAVGSHKITIPPDSVGAELLLHHIPDTEENRNILNKILDNWDRVLALKAEAEFLARSVPISWVPNSWDRTDDGKVSCPDDPELDNLSTYSGDTEIDHGTELRDHLCQLFCGKPSAETRYVEHACN